MLAHSGLIEQEGILCDASLLSNPNGSAIASNSSFHQHHHHHHRQHQHQHQQHRHHELHFPHLPCPQLTSSDATCPAPSPLDFLTHNVDEAPPRHEHTTSVNRSYSDLHQGAFLSYAFGLCAIRTALQQPMNLALARKQTSAVADKLTAWSVLRGIFVHEGRWRGLTRGIGALSVGCAISEVVYLCLFEWGREWWCIDNPITRDAISGYAADAVCRTVHIPLSIVAFRQMTAPATRRMGAWRTLQHMYAERGVRTVFAGYGTTLVVGCQWTAMWWALYGQAKAVLYGSASPLLQRWATSPSKADQGAEPNTTAWRPPSWCVSTEDNPIINGIASIATSASTAVLFNPYLVVRTNLQVTPGATLWSAACQVYRTRGLHGFYSGLLLSVNACVLDGVLASSSYEYAKMWADRTRGG